MHESVIAVRALGGLEASKAFMSNLFDRQVDFFDRNTEHKTRSQISSELCELAAATPGVDASAEDLKAYVAVDRSSPDEKNPGSKSTRVLKFYCKQHRFLGIQ